jgi:hypothetical protein
VTPFSERDLGLLREAAVRNAALGPAIIDTFAAIARWGEEIEAGHADVDELLAFVIAARGLMMSCLIGGVATAGVEPITVRAIARRPKGPVS